MFPADLGGCETAQEGVAHHRDEGDVHQAAAPGIGEPFHAPFGRAPIAGGGSYLLQILGSEESGAVDEALDYHGHLVVVGAVVPC